jgi:hypothetical protein
MCPRLLCALRSTGPLTHDKLPDVPADQARPSMPDNVRYVKKTRKSTKGVRRTPVGRQLNETLRHEDGTLAQQRNETLGGTPVATAESRSGPSGAPEAVQLDIRGQSIADLMD